MKVKIRDLHNAVPVAFTECKTSEFHTLINFIEDAGGVYNSITGEQMPVYSWQICLENGECYAEIVVGED